MVGLVSAVAAAACSEGGAQVGVPSATVGTEPPTTTTTHPYAVPPVIDAAYVNRVLEGLDKAYGDILRHTIQVRTISDEAVQRLRALYAQDRDVQLRVDLFQELIRLNFRGLRIPPGNQTTRIDHLFTASPGCIFARVVRDSTGVAEASPGNETRTYWVGLVPIDPTRNAILLNDTGWAYTFEGFPPPGFPDPPNQCAS
ncbi:MAG TPA: hypothetical protein VM390_03165 [Acidimicrobiales bacterium]|nr:hypothetical protein [Acidimicrobiales bacterium]